MNGICDPVDLRVITNTIVMGIYADNFKVFRFDILGYPVGTKDAKGSLSNAATDTFFGTSLDVADRLQVLDTMSSRFAIGLTLVYFLLAASTANSNTVNNVTLFSPVT